MNESVHGTSNLHTPDGMDEAIRDIARLFGSALSSESSPSNAGLQSLTEMMKMLCDDLACEVSFQLTGIKVLRACLYITSVEKSSEKDRLCEFIRFLNDDTPTLEGVGRKDLEGQRRFRILQTRFAQLGAMQVVTKFFCSNNVHVVHEALKLGAALMNPSVQEIFAQALAPASSEPFFTKLKSLFDESKESIKAQKRSIKHEVREAIFMRSAVDTEIKALRHRIAQSPQSGDTTKLESKMKKLLHKQERTSMVKASFSIAGIGKHMLDVLTMMMRLTRNSYTPLQDVLREQRVNNTSYNFISEAASFLAALEPELKMAIENKILELFGSWKKAFTCSSTPWRAQIAKTNELWQILEYLICVIES